jgi:hypothetical protein
MTAACPGRVLPSPPREAEPVTSGNIADSDQTAALGPVDVLVAYAGVGRTRSLVRGGGSDPALTLGHLSLTRL